MRNIILLLLFQSLFAVQIQPSSLQVLDIGAYMNGYYYLPTTSTAYNPSTGNSVSRGDACGSYVSWMVFITESQQVWCINFENKLNLMSPDFQTIEASYDAPYTTTLYAAGNYLILYSTKGSKLVIFDTIARNFFCELALKPELGDLESLWFANNGIFYPDGAKLMFIHCYGQNIIEGPKAPINFAGLNGSSLIFAGTQQVILYDLTNQMYTVGSVPPSIVMNDSYLLTTSIGSGVVNLGVITPQIGFSVLKTTNLGFNLSKSIVPVTCLDGVEILDIYNYESPIIYNLSSQSIIDFYTSNLPITLSNGSVVQYSNYGYSIFSPPGNLNFKTDEVAASYFDPSAPGLLYTLKADNNKTGGCYFLENDLENNQKQTFFFPQCKSANQLFEILAVDFDETGSPIMMVFLDQNYFYIFTETITLGPINFATFKPLYASANFTIDTVYTIFTIAEPKPSYQLLNISLATNKTGQTKVPFNWVNGIEGSYFLGYQANDISLSVFQLNPYQVFYTMNVNLENVDYCYPLGFVPYPPWFLNGLVCLVSGNAGQIEIVSTNGTITSLNLTEAYDLYLVDNSSFYASVNPAGLSPGAYQWNYTFVNISISDMNISNVIQY